MFFSLYIPFFLLVNSTKSKLNEVTISSKAISKFRPNLSELKIAMVHLPNKKKLSIIFNYSLFFLLILAHNIFILNICKKKKIRHKKQFIINKQ